MKLLTLALIFSASSTSALSIRVYNQDSKDHTVQLKCNGSAKSVTIKKSATATYTVQTSASTCQVTGGSATFPGNKSKRRQIHHPQSHRQKRIATMSCPNVRKCPLFPYFESSTLVKYWKEQYCMAEYEECARYQANIGGQRIPLRLLPNGTMLKRDPVCRRPARSRNPYWTNRTLYNGTIVSRFNPPGYQ